MFSFEVVEPAMHGIALVFAFGTALYSAFAGLMNRSTLWCWINPYPKGCKPSMTHGTAEEGNPKPCVRGDNIEIYWYAFYFIPLWSCIFIASKFDWCLQFAI